MKIVISMKISESMESESMESESMESESMELVYVDVLIMFDRLIIFEQVTHMKSMSSWV
jgi:hypothetical protein